MFETGSFFDSFEQFVKAAHNNSKEKGFWDEGVQQTITDGCMGPQPTLHKTRPINVGEKLMLMVTEIAEAFEAHRKGAGDQSCDKDCTVQDPNDPRGYRRLTNMEEEMADIVIRVADFCGWKGIDLGRVIYSKMAYNRSRPKMHGKTC